MPCWTIVDARGEFPNAWDTPSGIALRAHNGQRVLQTDCETVEKALEKHVGHAFHPHRFSIATLQPGEFHPRMHRQAFSSTRQEFPDPSVLYIKEMAAALESARNLFVQLRHVFRYLEPSENNKSAYGDQLRSLLILACTEVESAWRSVLLVNNGASRSEGLNTRNYVMLLEPMRLNEWRITLSGYPEYPELTPFATWDRHAPTESLPWYKAYNHVKHDREGCLFRATLEHVLSAMSGVLVMLLAQFGLYPLCGPNPLSSGFILKAAPSWRLADLYVPELVNDGNGVWRGRLYF